MLGAIGRRDDCSEWRPSKAAFSSGSFHAFRNAGPGEYPDFNVKFLQTLCKLNKTPFCFPQKDYFLPSRMLQSMSKVIIEVDMILWRKESLFWMGSQGSGGWMEVAGKRMLLEDEQPYLEWWLGVARHGKGHRDTLGRGQNRSHTGVWTRAGKKQLWFFVSGVQVRRWEMEAAGEIYGNWAKLKDLKYILSYLFFIQGQNNDSLVLEFHGPVSRLGHVY